MSTITEQIQTEPLKLPKELEEAFVNIMNVMTPENFEKIINRSSDISSEELSKYITALKPLMDNSEERTKQCFEELVKKNDGSYIKTLYNHGPIYHFILVFMLVFMLGFSIYYIY
jgi:hypothetical protein